MKKPHITTTRTFEFTHPNGKQKIKLTEKEAQEFLSCLSEALGHIHIPKPLLNDLFKDKIHRGGQISSPPLNWPPLLPNPTLIGNLAKGQTCLYDNIDPGKIMGLVCNCPKCAIHCSNSLSPEVAGSTLNS